MPTNDTTDGPNPSGYCLCGCGERTPLGERTRVARMTVKGLPIRYLKGHNGRHREPPLRYKVEKDTGCFVWQGTVDDDGYPRARVNNQMILVHRWVYENANEALPSSTHVHHECGVKRCIRLDHLREVKASDHNIIHKRKLSDDDVTTIRELSATESTGAIAEKFSISRSYVGQLIRRRYRPDDSPPPPVMVIKKLSDSDVAKIRSLRGVMSLAEVALKFGISKSHACGIQRGSQRKNVA